MKLKKCLLILSTAVFLLPGCNLISSSPMEFIAYQTGTATVTNYASGDVQETAIPGCVLISPSPSESSFTLDLENKQSYNLSVNTINTAPARGTVTAMQTFPAEIRVFIRDSSIGDLYRLILKIKNADGPRHFANYTGLPLIVCNSPLSVSDLTVATDGDRKRARWIMQSPEEHAGINKVSLVFKQSSGKYSEVYGWNGTELIGAPRSPSGGSILFPNLPTAFEEFMVTLEDEFGFAASMATPDFNDYVFPDDFARILSSLPPNDADNPHTIKVCGINASDVPTLQNLYQSIPVDKFLDLDLSDCPSGSDYPRLGDANVFPQLVGLTLPAGITGTHGNAFPYGALSGINYPNLKTINAPGLETIGDSAFAGSKITSINLPNIQVIGISAFFNSSIVSIDLSASLASIGNNAFQQCGSLTTVTIRAATPPALSASAFNYTNVTNIYVPAGSVAAYKAAWTALAGKISAIP
jgi:hypothetical protein